MYKATSILSFGTSEISLQHWDIFLLLFGNWACTFVIRVRYYRLLYTHMLYNFCLTTSKTSTVRKGAMCWCKISIYCFLSIRYKILNEAMWTGCQFFLQNRYQSQSMFYHYGSPPGHQRKLPTCTRGYT